MKVFQKGSGDFLAGIFFIGIVMNRKQHPGFDLDKGCGHDQKIAGNIDIHGFHPFDIIQITVGNQRNRDVVDIDFIFSNQIDEKIHRTFKNIF